MVHGWDPGIDGEIWSSREIFLLLQIQRSCNQVGFVVIRILGDTEVL